MRATERCFCHESDVETCQPDHFPRQGKTSVFAARDSRFPLLGLMDFRGRLRGCVDILSCFARWLSPHRGTMLLLLTLLLLTLGI